MYAASNGSLISPQCAIPAFRGLFQSKNHNDAVRQLLFELATWHALAKLRRHTTATISDLRNSTVRLGQKLRHFVRVICPKYNTRDLKNEAQARARAMARKGKAVTAKPSSKKRTLNLVTYKLHALAHYADDILNFGATDSYSTQIVSHETLFELDAHRFC